MSRVEPLGEEEFAELDDLLLSEGLPESTMDVCAAEGFLTAIAIGPVTVMPDQWLPRIFGSEADEPMPEFPSPKVVRRVIDLIMRLYTSVIVTFEVAPEEFEPTFYTRDVDGKTYTIVDEWCNGFLQGIRLTQEAWRPLLEEQPDFLRPFQLFATEEGWAELASAPDEAVMRAEWSNKIAPTVHAIHAYWLPYREATATNPRRSKALPAKSTVGRNEPCPCGSGMKYKYCCGRPPSLH
jgi:uncharacterized protein